VLFQRVLLPSFYFPVAPHVEALFGEKLPWPPNPGWSNFESRGNHPNLKELIEQVKKQT
jgi:hypothetical protein